MNDQRKTKKQLLEELQQERELVERERERSLALQEVSNRLAGAHDTDEVLDLIVNEAARLVGASAAWIRLLEGEKLVIRANTESISGYLAESSSAVLVEERTSPAGHVMATKKPLVMEDAAEDEMVSPAQRLKLKKHGLHGRAGVPLLANNRSIGVLFVADHRVRRFSEDEVSLLTAFADQAALVLDKARLLNEAEREKERSDALYQVSNKLAGVYDTDEVLDLIVNEAARLLDANGAYIRLLEGPNLVPSASTGSLTGYLADNAKAQPTVAVDSVFGMGPVMATKKPVVRDDAAEDEGVRVEIRAIVKKHGFHGTALVPMVANDRSIGVLAVMDKRIRRFTEDEVSLLSAFADQAALALDKARLLNEAEREKERSDALYQVSNRLAGVHDTDEVLDLIVNEAARLLGASGAYIRLLRGDSLVASATTQSTASLLEETATLHPFLRVEEGTSLAGQVMATKKPLMSEDGQNDGLMATQASLMWQKYDFHGFVMVPLLSNDRSIGVLNVVDTRIRRFTEDEVSLLSPFADQASLALQKSPAPERSGAGEGTLRRPLPNIQPAGRRPRHGRNSGPDRE